MHEHPKIFIGTMYSGEAEFNESTNIIESQKGVNVKRLVIENLNEIDAHNKLWEAWNKTKNQYDLFVKIDADTILNHDLCLHNIWNLFQQNPRATGAQLLLHDYYTQQHIAGLNCFTPKVIFKKSKDKLMPDRVDTNHDIELRGEIVNHLNPIGLHCKNPSNLQSFHFGLHRALKKQKNILKKIAELWSYDYDTARGFALLGASKASFWMRNNFNYNDKKFNSAFDSIKNLDNKDFIEKYCKSIL